MRMALNWSKIFSLQIFSVPAVVKLGTENSKLNNNMNTKRMKRKIFLYLAFLGEKNASRQATNFLADCFSKNENEGFFGFGGRRVQNREKPDCCWGFVVVNEPGFQA